MEKRIPFKRTKQYKNDPGHLINTLNTLFYKYNHTSTDIQRCNIFLGQESSNKIFVTFNGLDMIVDFHQRIIKEYNEGKYSFTDIEETIDNLLIPCHDKIIKNLAEMNKTWSQELKKHSA